LERFLTLHPYQLAGQVANINFWVSEVRHVLRAIDGYPTRFRQLKVGQTDFIVTHGTKVSLYGDRVSPSPPRRVSDVDLQHARRSVTEAMYRFLLRLQKEKLLPSNDLCAICTELDIGVDPADFS